MSEELQYSIDGKLGFVILSRPRLHNAISRAMWESFPDIFINLKSKGAQTIIVTGQGSSFASGADITEFKQISDWESARGFWSAIKECLDFIVEFELPTIAMINGACIGGGLLLALATDIRIASENSSFALPIARLGIVLDEANIARLVSLVGPAFAKELLFSGATITSTAAEQRGLVNRIVPANALQNEVIHLARQFVLNAATSLLQSKKTINKIVGSGNEDTAEERLVVNSYLSSEFRSRLGRQDDSD